jgi:hypothetical protein
VDLPYRRELMQYKFILTIEYPKEAQVTAYKTRILLKALLTKFVNKLAVPSLKANERKRYSPISIKLEEVEGNIIHNSQLGDFKQPI